MKITVRITTKRKTFTDNAQLSEHVESRVVAARLAEVSNLKRAKRLRTLACTRQIHKGVKPGQPINLDNLCPIFFTSCLGKLLEHAILYRLTAYVEKAGIFPTEMLGFRMHLSAQDVMVQLQQDIFRQSPGLDTKAVLALDLRGAFNNVSHATILREPNGLDFGKRILISTSQTSSQLEQPIFTWVQSILWNSTWVALEHSKVQCYSPSFLTSRC